MLEESWHEILIHDYRLHQKFTTMKTLLSITIPAISLFVAGAWNMHHSPEPRATSKTGDVPAAALSAPAGQKTPKMQAKTTTLYKNETLELQFAAPNAPYLGVVDPSGHFFYVVFPSEAAIGQLKPLIDSERFAPLHTLKINTRTLTADPYTHGIYRNQRVFTQTGAYTFILGENLHVDDPGLLDKVRVYYNHKPRPAFAQADVAMNN